MTWNTAGLANGIIVLSKAKRCSMPFNVTLDFPLDVEEKVRQQSLNLAADVKEAYALELFR